MDLSFTEIFVLALLGLLIFGPERLPKIARNVGKALRSFQSETSRAMSELRTAADIDLEGTDAGTSHAPLAAAAPSPAAVPPVTVAPPATDAPPPENGQSPGLIFEDT